MQMSLLARLRSMQSLTGRPLAALVVLSWLGLALQPCCATASQAVAAQGGHDAVHHPAGDDCPHCPPRNGSGDSDPGTALDCPALAAAAVTAPVDSSLASLPPAVPLPERVALVGPDVGGVVPIALQRRWRPPTVSLQEQYCTHLE
jgi:hypothetical protein